MVAHAVLSDWSDLQIYARSPVKILFGSQNPFNMEMRMALGFNAKKRINFKAFCCFWCCRKGFIKGIKGGTSCCIGEVKGGVQA